MFLLKCPKCGNRMKYQGKNTNLASKRKACVYCGSSFAISNHIVKKIKS